MKKIFYNIGLYIPYRSFKCGDPVIGGALIGASSMFEGLLGADAQSEANYVNLQIAQKQLAQQEKLFHEGNDFNAEQAQIARDFNAQEAQTNRVFQAGQLQKQLNWYENYNSAKSQVQRYLNAGLNPAALAGKTDYSGSFGVPSGAAATASPATAAAAPSVAGAHVEPVNPLKGVLSGAMQGLNSYMQSRKTGAESQGIFTENQYKELLIKKGIQLSDSEIKKNYEQANSFIADVDLTKQKINESGAIIRNLDASTEKLDVETQIENQRKIYASDFFKYQVNELEQKYKFTKGMADTVVKLTYSKIAANYGQAAASYANAEYLSAYAKLAPYEQAVLDNTSQLLEVQERREKYGLFLDRQFGWKDRFWHNESLKAGVDRQQYENTNGYRVIQGVKDVAVGVGAAGGAAYGTYKGSKFFNKKFGNPSQNPFIMNGGYYQNFFNRQPYLLK